MNLFNIEKAYNLVKQRGWDKVYWAVDLHDTLFKGGYSNTQKIELYPYAQLVLSKLSERFSENVLIAFSSTYEDIWEIIDLELFSEHNIYFKYLNCNPECQNTEYGDFSKKFYYNILLDDKAGFEGKTDWKLIYDELIRLEKI